MSGQALLELNNKFTLLASRIKQYFSKNDFQGQIALVEEFLEFDTSDGKENTIFRYFTMWKCSDSQDEFCWQLRYEPSFQVYCVEAHFMKNGGYRRLHGIFWLQWASKMIEKYNDWILSHKMNFRFVINPNDGCIRLEEKLLLVLSQFDSIILSASFLKQNIWNADNMFKVMLETRVMFDYAEGLIKEMPDILMNKNAFPFEFNPKNYLYSIHSILHFNQNCDESLETFTNNQDLLEFIIKNQIPLSQEIVRFINFYIGQENNVEIQKDRLNQSEVAETISMSFEDSLKSEGSSNDDMFLARKITILTDPYLISWKKVAKGGYGIIEKASVEYELEDFNSFSDKKDRYKENLIRKSDSKQMRKIGHELEIFKSLRNQFHENIKAHYIPTQNMYSCYIFSKFQSNLSLSHYIESNRKSISLLTILCFCEQITKGLLFLKEKNIYHLDIKPNNVLVTPDLVIKISDFGEAYNSLSGVNQFNHKHAYTIPYAAPQIFEKYSGYLNEKIDVYSLGVTIYRLLFHKHIFGEIINRDQFIDKINDSDFQTNVVPEMVQRIGFPEILGPIMNLVTRCLQKEQEERPNLFYLLVMLSLCKNYIQKSSQNKHFPLPQYFKKYY